MSTYAVGEAHRQGFEVDRDGQAVILVYGETKSEARQLAERVAFLLNHDEETSLFTESMA